MFRDRQSPAEPRRVSSAAVLPGEGRGACAGAAAPAPGAAGPPLHYEAARWPHFHPPRVPSAASFHKPGLPGAKRLQRSAQLTSCCWPQTWHCSRISRHVPIKNGWTNSDIWQGLQAPGGGGGFSYFSFFPGFPPISMALACSFQRSGQDQDRNRLHPLLLPSGGGRFLLAAGRGISTDSPPGGTSANALESAKTNPWPAPCRHLTLGL